MTDTIRYARHIALPEVGEAGQRLLHNARVLVIGAGGLGSPALLYLAAAGIGHLTLIDPDRVSLSNLQRQILYEEADIGRRKIDAARDRLEETNRTLSLTTIAEPFHESNAYALCTAHDLVIDGSDNFPTRYLLNDSCLKTQTPWIMGALGRYEGYLASFLPDSPCYRCFQPHPPEEAQSCAEAGVLGPLAGLIGTWQALEALKLLLGLGETLETRLLRYHAMTHRSTLSHRIHDPDCEACGLEVRGSVG